MTKVGILGFGNVGVALAKGFLLEGHQVQAGGRTKSGAETKVNKSGLEHVTANTNQNVAAWADLVIIATPGSASLDTVKSVASVIESKTVIDVTTPKSGLAEGGIVPTMFTDRNDSLLEQLQRAVPKANFVKAFATVGFSSFYKPAYKGGEPAHWIAGDSQAAKQEVIEILKSFGWSSIIDLGGVAGGRIVEPIGQAWVAQGLATGDWDFAFSIVKRA